jgi:hypothetical protein
MWKRDRRRSRQNGWRAGSAVNPRSQACEVQVQVQVKLQDAFADWLGGAALSSLLHQWRQACAAAVGIGCNCHRIL